MKQIQLIHETSAFLVKSGSLQMSVYNVYGSQNEFVESVTRVFISQSPSIKEHHICGSLEQNCPLHRICGNENYKCLLYINQISLLPNHN